MTPPRRPSLDRRRAVTLYGLCALCAASVAIALAGVARAAVAPRSSSAAALAPARSVVVAAPADVTYVFTLGGASFEQLLAVPEVRALARSGGAALMVPQEPVDAVLERLRAGIQPATSGGRRSAVVRVELGQVPAGPAAGAFLRAAGSRVEEVVRRTSRLALVAVVGTTPSPEMTAAKDAVLPLVVARGRPVELFPAAGQARALTSDATRRAGVVSSSDLGPTVARATQSAWTRPLPGAPVRAIDEPAPFELHARYLAMRRMTVPVQVAALLAVAIAGAFLVGLLRARDRVPASILERAAWVGLAVAPLAASLLAAGHLPSLTYLTVGSLAVASTVLGVLAVVPLRRLGLLAPSAALGAGVLAFFVLEAASGFRGALTPLLGGSQLDGGRFYGLPNVFVGLVVGAALYAVAERRTATGVGVLVGAACFMGLPSIGANVGGALTGFAAAGLWLGLRVRGRPDAAALGVAAFVAAAGTALILAAHVVLPGAPTHATALIEGRAGGVTQAIVRRLGVGIDLIARNPFAVVPAVGVVVMAVVSLRPPPVVRAAFDAHPRWRDALLSLSLAGTVALLAEDSGPAAAGLAFGLALGGLLYVSLLVASGKMEPHEPAASALD